MRNWKSDKQRRKVMAKLSMRKAKAFAKEETQASKEYKKLGLTRISADEERHAKFFKQKVRELGGKK